MGCDQSVDGVRRGERRGRPRNGGRESTRGAGTAQRVLPGEVSGQRGCEHPAEGIARGDAKTSKLVGRRVEDIRLPKGARIGAIVRGDGRDSEVLMPHHDLVIQADDHIIIFIPHKRLVREVEKLFEVGATFFG